MYSELSYRYVLLNFVLSTYLVDIYNTYFMYIWYTRRCVVHLVDYCCCTTRQVNIVDIYIHTCDTPVVNKAAAVTKPESSLCAPYTEYSSSSSSAYIEQQRHPGQQANYYCCCCRPAQQIETRGVVSLELCCIILYICPLMM